MVDMLIVNIIQFISWIFF